MDGPPWVLDLSDPAAGDGDLTGAKAANLARAAAAGLPVLPGFVITTAGTARAPDDIVVDRALRDHWRSLDGEDHALVVRSSSTIEDADASSMAGRFTSILDVTGWDSFRAAVADVVSSAERVPAPDGRARPIAVLVQVQVAPRLAGVLFGVDPVTGDRHHLVVESVAERPDRLVSGTTTADHYVISRRGRVIDRTPAGDVPALPRRLRTRLARLARCAEEVFGGPQDIEWAYGRQGELWMLQSRPITTVAEPAPGRGALVLGPGPVAETFPRPLRPLEVELWIEPLRVGISRALRATGAVSDRAIAASPVVTTVGGWAAVDLRLLGLTSGTTTFGRRLNPIAMGRRLGVSWRVGRLRVALPRLARSVVATVDRDLSSLPALAELTPPGLLELLRRTRAELATVHTYEVLAGMLLRPEPGELATPLVALQLLHDGREAGWSDAEIVLRSPVVLALSTPAIGAPTELPQVGPSPGAPTDLDRVSIRDALRLRARWLQELGARAAWQLGGELERAGRIEARPLVAAMTLGELGAVAAGGSAPPDLAERLDDVGPPLPVAFALDPRGRIRRTGHGHAAAAAGLPAGGGRVMGVVCNRVNPDSAGHGVVLVTRHLEPGLAPLLPYLDAIVAETGSPLSHLAILARELGVTAVAGVPDACSRFPPGAHVVVDGTTGEVTIVDPAEVTP